MEENFRGYISEIFNSILWHLSFERVIFKEGGHIEGGGHILEDHIFERKF